jgi:phage terminase large subunit GpA-like protein
VEATTGGKKLKFGVVFKIVNSDFFKAQFYADLRKRAPTPDERAAGMGYPQGYFHMPKDSSFGDEHCKQLCSEKLVTLRNKFGRSTSEWEKIRNRNEALDTQLYCDAAAWDFGAYRFQPKHWGTLRQRLKELEPPPAGAPKPEQAPPKPKAPSWLGNNKGWLNR